jgi:murein DD-endopeptidase MepM/ murein hydrolase activator NlpD
VIFGKRGIIYRLILIHFVNTFSLSWFLRLIATSIGSYSRSRREAQARSASTGGRMLRRIYGHIVAQGLGVEKIGAAKLTGASAWDSPTLPRRSLTAVSQIGMASVIVLVAWVYWPGEAAAPALSATLEQPRLAAVGALDSRPQQADTSRPSNTFTANASSQQIAETKDRFDALRAEKESAPAEAAPKVVEPNRAVPSENAHTLLPLLPQPFGVKIADSTAQAAAALNGPSRPGGLADLLASLAEVTAGPRQAVGQIVAGVGELDASTERRTEAEAAEAEAAEAEASADKRVLVEAQPTSTPPPPAPAPTPGPAAALVPGPQWADFTPAAAPAVDHFWLGQPHPAGYNQFYSPNYQFGSTANARYRIHHGVDVASDAGTPVLAMGEGEVVHAGPDNPTLLGPYNNFYGNSVVVRLNRRLPTPEGEQDVYVLLGHMSEVYVERGQQVTPDVVVGAVGMTGIAIGPHLHVEVRVGQNSYLHSVNPALWMQNSPGTGSVAVRLLTADGRSWSDARLSLLRYEGGGTRWVRTIEIYPDAENISADPAWGENGALSQLAAGGYWIGGVVNGEKFGQNITIYSGETAFVEFRTQQ